MVLAYLISRNALGILHEKTKKMDASRGSENFRKIAAVCDVERIKKGPG